MEKLGYCHRWSIIGPNHFTLQHYMLIVNVKFRTRDRGHAKHISLHHNIWSFWIPITDGDGLQMVHQECHYGYIRTIAETYSLVDRLLKSMRKLYRLSRKSLTDGSSRAPPESLPRVRATFFANGRVYLMNCVGWTCQSRQQSGNGEPSPLAQHCM